MRRQNGLRWVVPGIEKNLYLTAGSYGAPGQQDPLPAIQDDVFVAANNLLNQVLRRAISYHKTRDDKEVRLGRKGFSEFTTIGVASLGTSCTRVLSIASIKSEFSF